MVLRYVVTSDIHLTNSNPNFRHDENGVSDLLKSQMDFIDWVTGLFPDENKSMIDLGDFVNESTLNPLMQTYVNRAFTAMTYGTHGDGSGIMVEGNHCMSDLDGRYTVLGAIGEIYVENFAHNGFTNIITSDNTVVHSFEGLDKWITFHVFPYRSDYDDLAERITKRNDELLTHPEYRDGINIMLFHFPIINAILDNGVPAPSGVNLPETHVSNFDLCLGGDFHKRQQVYDNLHYVGAPFDLKFGENYERGVTTLEVHQCGKIELNFIPNPFQYHLIKTDVDTFLGKDWGDMSRHIFSIHGKATSKQISEIESMREDCYRMTLHLNRGKGLSRTEVDIATSGERGQRDVDLIRAQMIRGDVEEPVINRAVNIFEEKIEPNM